MTTLSITSKGQITLKKELLRQMGVHPGDKVEAQVLPNGKLEISPAQPKRHISELFGMLKRPGQRPMSLEEIEEGIGQGAADEYRRSIGKLPE
jgi:bifunctional DNA-binding transcriptional regulator/antitoxin component of YhaV-PrlF toxin-antitoxin module